MFAEFKKTKIHYTDTGKGRVLVLLHGFLGSHEVWSEFVKKLSKKFRVIAIDLPGHGETPSIGYYHSMELLAQSVKAVLDKAGVRRYIITGHSMGGYVALTFAELFPENVSGICLFNSTSYADSEEKKKEREKVIRLVKKSHKHYVGEVVVSLFAPENLPKISKEVEKVSGIAQKITQQSIINSLEGMKERKSRDLILKFAEFPILFIVGKKDGVINYETMYAQMALCAVRRLVRFVDLIKVILLEGLSKVLTKFWEFSIK